MPKMKRIPLKWNQTIFVNGYPCKISRCKRGGVNLWVDADCPIAGESVEVVDLTQKLEPFGAAMASAQPVNVLRNKKARVG